jgi:hypothetical protein
MEKIEVIACPHFVQRNKLEQTWLSLHTSNSEFPSQIVLSIPFVQRHIEYDFYRIQHLCIGQKIDRGQICPHPIGYACKQSERDEIR